MSDEFNGSLYFKTKSYRFKTIEAETAYPGAEVSFVLNQNGTYELLCKFHLRSWAFVSDAKLKVGDLPSVGAATTEVVDANHVYEGVLLSLPPTILPHILGLTEDARIKFYGRKQSFVASLDSSLFRVALKDLVEQKDILLGSQSITPLTSSERKNLAVELNATEKQKEGGGVWSYDPTSDTLTLEIDISFMAETRLQGAKSHFLQLPNLLRYWKQVGVRQVVIKNKGKARLDIPLTSIL